MIIRRRVPRRSIRRLRRPRSVHLRLLIMISIRSISVRRSTMCCAS